ncbi:MgtC/SapB family protein [Marinibaculum pumilum]|uniref:MgtC/SapB family protein n=1 Tax=Marinibaculum pumilum TaxID=1766165 RepID=A0ABV7KVW3_9PROT
MTDLEIFQRLAVALAIGTLVGLERGWQTRETEEQRRTAGLRTFALIGLAGGVLGLLAAPFGPAPFAAGAVLATGAVAGFRWREAKDSGDYGITTVIAALCTYALAGYAAVGSLALAGAAAVAMTLFLALKNALHGWLAKLTWPELRSALILLAMSLIVLPLLPDRPVGPLDLLNPYLVWSMTILIALVSFAGYVAIKAMGARQGLLLAGLVGGLASSTATTAGLARLSRPAGIARNGVPSGLAAAGILMSFAVMYLRVPVVAFVLAPEVGLRLAPAALAAAAISAAGGGLVLLRRERLKATAPPALPNPLDLWEVLKFGALIAIVSVLAGLLAQTFGDAGLQVLAFVSGLADVDAPTVSLAGLAGTDAGETPAATAASGIALAVLANMLAKCGLAWALAAPRTALLVSLGTAAGLAAAAAAFFLAAAA